MTKPFNQLAQEFLAAEVEVLRSEVFAMKLGHDIEENPGSNVVRRFADVTGTVSRNCAATYRDTRHGYARHIERACYGWRRDYREWPSRFNLADRLATETGMSRKRAERLILDSINDPADGCMVHCIRGSVIDMIRAGDELPYESWSPQGHDDVRFYVLAEAQYLPSIHRWTTTVTEAASA